MADASSALEIDVRSSKTNLQKEEFPRSSDKEAPISGFDRFLATLSLPTPEEQQLMKKRIEQAKVEWLAWHDNSEQDLKKEPASPRKIIQGRDPESRDLVVKEANFILKELGPQVVGNIKKIIDEIPDIDNVSGTTEFFKKRSDDLKHLLSFDFIPKDRPMNVQEESQLRYALSLIHFMTDGYVVGPSDGAGLYELGLDRLTKRLMKDIAYTNPAEAQRPSVVEKLAEQAVMVHDALELSIGIKTIPRPGLIDGSSVRGVNETLTFYARRVDPAFYLNLEDKMMGLSLNGPTVEVPPDRPVVVPPNMPRI